MDTVREKKYVVGPEGEKYSAGGAFFREDRVRFSLLLPEGKRADTAVLRLHDDRDGSMRLFPMQAEEGGFTEVLSLAELLGEAEDGLFYYVYDVYYPTGCVTYGGEAPLRLYPVGEDGRRQLLICRTGADAPDWLRGGVIYHIFVDRFCPSGRAEPKPGTVMNPDWENGIPQYAEKPGDDLPNNEFFGGDLFGIAGKMDYIASLGVNCLYLSPVFEAASNHKYDTGDYSRIDPMFGGEEGLDALLASAEKRGIRVIFDGVFNHTGSDSLYFNKNGRYPSLGAYQSKDSPYYPWYNFSDFPDGYESWWGMPTLPRVRCDHPSYREYILGEEGIVAKWTKRGVSGWRLDVVDELSDGFLDELNSRLQKTAPETLIFGEVWEDATSKIAYGRRCRYLRGGQLHSVMNYPIREAVIAYIRAGDAERFRGTVTGIYRRYPAFAANLLMNHLSTHDTARILTVLSGDSPEGFTNRELAVKRLTKEQREKGVQLLLMAYALISALPGVPCIFYGDEAGIEGYGDPFCRRPFPWGREDPVLLAGFRKIGALHRKESVFRDGALRLVSVTPEKLLLVRENGKDGAVLLAVNRPEKELRVHLSGIVTGLGFAHRGKTFALPPYTARFYRCTDGIEEV